MTGQPQMPKGWRLVRLGDVAHIHNNRATAGEDERMPYVALEHILYGGRLTTHGKSDDRNISPDQRAGQRRRRTSLLECACHLGFGVEWEETVHQDTGLLGFTTKHLYFSGPKKKFRVRYDRIVDFEPFSDGFGLMRDAQTAKMQSFRTGDGWFAYNLGVNLAQM